MSKLFYDHLIVIEDLEDEIKRLGLEPEEREEIQQLIDELVHHRVLGCVLDRLPKRHHRHFLDSFHQAPYDEAHLIWLAEKIEGDVEKVIKEEIQSLKKEILEDIKQSKFR